MPKKIKKKGKVIMEHGLTGKLKMSEVLEEYARPLLEETKDIDSVQVAIVIASICWNIASMPEDEQEELMRNALAEISKISGDYETSQKIIETMIERKKMLFSKYNKLILNQEVIPLDKGGYYLTVASTEILKRNL